VTSARLLPNALRISRGHGGALARYSGHRLQPLVEKARSAERQRAESRSVLSRRIFRADSTSY